jgi:poly(3-hydroxybutyrate) depolymerase
VVDATETNFLQLSYEWQVSVDGVNYDSANLVNNTSTSYTTNQLAESDSGLYVRVAVSNGIPQETVFSNTFANIGDRIIIVSSDAIILTNVTFNDNYPENTTLEVGQTLSYTVSSALQNLPLTDSDTLLQFEWQESQDSGDTWQTLTPGGNVSITTTIIRFDPEVDNIYKQSTINIFNINFDYNLRQYRVIITYPGAANNPLVAPARILFVEPVIQITKQPGTGDDTLTSFCYKSLVPSSDGKIKLEVDAFSTSERPLFYLWQYTLNGDEWENVNDLIDAFNAVYKLGTNDQSSVLELERMIYYDTLGFRCLITGSVGEDAIFTNEHYVLMKDFEVSVVDPSTNINIIEDKYGDIENRSSFPEAIQRALILSSLDISRNTGLNGQKTLIFERLLPGQTTGGITGTQITIAPSDGQTFEVDSTSYPVMGSLYVPTSLTSSSIDVVVLYHGTLQEGGNVTIAQAAQTSLEFFLDENELNIRDKIIFSVAYPQDHISNTRQYNLPNVGTENPTFLMGDNLPYARAALKWAINSLNAFMASNGISKTIGNVYTFGHSQGGKLVAKMNTLETGVTKVISNAPGPIQFDQTCAISPSNTSCAKVGAIHGASVGDGSEPYRTIGLETYTTGHNAPLLFTQALDDSTGGGNQPTWLQDYINAINAIPTNPSVEYVTTPTGGHAAFTTDDVIQEAIRISLESTSTQIQETGSSTWETVGDEVFIDIPNSLINYTLSPSNNPDNYDVEYFTKPLRFDLDDGIKYRLKVSSTALFDISNGNKILSPYVGPEITVNVFRTAYITNQPQDAEPFANTNASFSIDAVPSSGIDISYQWQYNTSDSSVGWINVPASSPFSGTTTNILIISNVPSNPVYRFFRCVISVPNQLSSTSSDAATLNPRRDLFIFIDNINVVFTEEFQNVVFETNAASLSASQVSYQWQKSINYNPLSPNSAVWTNLSGQTSNVLNLISVTSSDVGFYRCRIISFGGEIGFTNVARLEIQPVNIIILKNIQTSATFLEGEESSNQSSFFDVEAYATVGDTLNYQWQIKRPGDVNFQNFASGANNTSATSRFFRPTAFSRSDTGSIIRCRLSSPFVPFDVFTNECVITVNRRFYYFADSAVKRVVSGESVFLDLNPSWTGGIPSYQWETSTNGGSTWSNIPSATSSQLSASVVSGQVFRCKITLSNCNQHEYSRNNSTFIVSVSPTAYTVTVTISLTTSVSKPIYYSQEIEKTGSSIGTVICVPKPAGYVNNTSANSDDLPQWRISTTGHVDSFSSSFDPSSTVSSGAIYNANKPSWSNSSYISPKWRLSRDRFQGYIELRGQWLKKSEFPELYRIIGDSYGSTSGSAGNFRLPNLYGKTLMGTGNVNNNSGSVSIQPRWGPDGTSGGDKNIPGTTGGYWNYWSTFQLPPGSPGILSASDGRAGLDFPATFTLGNFKTTGFDEVFTSLQPSFGGTVTYDVPGIVATTTTVPSHNHQGISVGYEEFPVVLSGGCNTIGKPYPGGTFDVDFPETRPASGFVDSGPAYVSNPGISHSHGLSLNSVVEASNSVSANRNDSIGSGGGSVSLSGLNFSMASAGMSIESTELTMTNQSRSIFDDSLRFYLRNSESLPLRVPYFRLRYMIKAY